MTQKGSLAKIGKKNPMYGKRHSEESKKKMRLKRSKQMPPTLGKKFSLESRETMRKATKKAWATGKKKGGWKLSEIVKAKMAKLQTGTKKPWSKPPHYFGEKNPNWQGGKSFEPYGLEFNKQLKEKIRERDNYRCQECFRHQDELFTKTGRRYKLNIHHVDYNKRNNNSDNLISLCRNCHMQTNFNREDWINYFQKKYVKNTKPSFA